MWRKRFIGPFLSDLPRHTPRHVFSYVRPRSLPTIQFFPTKIICPPSSDLPGTMPSSSMTLDMASSSVRQPWPGLGEAGSATSNTRRSTSRPRWQMASLADPPKASSSLSLPWPGLGEAGSVTSNTRAIAPTSRLYPQRLGLWYCYCSLPSLPRHCR